MPVTSKTAPIYKHGTVLEETNFMPFPWIEKGNMLSVSISSGAYVSNGMTVMRAMLKLRTITEVPYKYKKNLDPVKPGEILREDFLKPLDISINKLSRELSVPPNRISEIVNGKRSITTDTALRLQRYFGVEAQFWLNLQTEYDLRMMKRKIWTEIERRIIPIEGIPAIVYSIALEHNEHN